VRFRHDMSTVPLLGTPDTDVDMEWLLPSTITDVGLSEACANPLTVLYGVTPQPYFVLVMGVLVFYALSYTMALVRLGLDCCRQQCCNRSLPSGYVPIEDGTVNSSRQEAGVWPADYWQWTDLNQGDTRLLTELNSGAIPEHELYDRLLDWTMRVDPIFVLIQFVVHVAHFGYIIYSLRATVTHWQRYTEVYVRLVNSGAPILFVAIVLAAWTAVDLHALEHRGSVAIFISGLGAFALLLPGIYTHVIPMIGAYVWLFAPALSVTFAAVWLIWHIRSTTVRSESTCVRWLVALASLLLKILSVSLLVWTLQSAMNYGVLLYARTGYINVVVDEYRMRDYSCYEQRVYHSTEQLVSCATLL